jgi:hypothetical protein
MPASRGRFLLLFSALTTNILGHLLIIKGCLAMEYEKDKRSDGKGEAEARL